MVKGSIEWEHSEEDGLVVRIKPGFTGMDTGEAGQHAIAARREILLTMRSLIDVAVKRTEEKEGEAKKKATKIDVE